MNFLTAASVRSSSGPSPPVVSGVSASAVVVLIEVSESGWRAFPMQEPGKARAGNGLRRSDRSQTYDPSCAQFVPVLIACVSASRCILLDVGASPYITHPEGFPTGALL